MAETAKIVNPAKIVVLPDTDAGCSLEQSCPAPQLEEFLQGNAAKNYYVIAYINCRAGGEGAERLHLHERQRGEDRRGRAEGPADPLRARTRISARGSWSRPAARWTCGRAPATSTSSSPATASTRSRREHPDAKVVAHPECTYAVRMLADEVCSTEKMVGYCRNSPAQNFIIVTESGMLHRLRARSARTRSSSPARPDTAPAPTAAT